MIDEAKGFVVDEKTGDIDPQNYFDYIKSKKENCTDEFLDKAYEVTMKQVRKAMATGQNLMVRRLHYALSVIERERKLLVMGVDAFVLREDIEYFIDKIRNKRVKVVDLEFFPREVPDEIVEKVAKLKENKIFDNYYVVFTDYTGKIANETKADVKKEAIRRDPILFGTFEQKIDNIYNISDRFYYIGDWEDEYCDLTLTKMVQELISNKRGTTESDVVKELAIPEATEENIRAYVNRLDEADDERRFVLSRPVKKTLFSRIKTAWKELTK